MSENSINNNVDPTPLVAKSIEKDIDIARTHLNNHVTTEEEILTLDKIVNIARFILSNRNKNKNDIKSGFIDAQVCGTLDIDGLRGILTALEE